MPTNNEISIRGGYVPFGLRRDYHLDVVGDAIDKIAQQHEKALEQKATIQAAIGKVNLNETETEWKQKLMDDVSNQIDEAARYGNYASALTKAVSLAGEVASNQELLAKEKENENYSAWRKNIDNLYLNAKIDKDTKDYFLDKVKYNFNGVYDDSGKFKTYTSTDYELPLQKMELGNLFSWVGQTVAEQSGSSQGVRGKSISGEDIGYYSPDVAALVHTGSGWSRKDYQTIKNVWDEAMKRHPEAVAYLQQQMDVNEWKLDNINDKLEDETLDENTRAKLENEKKMLEEDLYVNGDISKPYTIQQYLIASSDKTLKAMAYNRQNSTFNVSGGGSRGGSGGDSEEPGGYSSVSFEPTSAGPSGSFTGNGVPKNNNPIGSGRDIEKILNRP